MEYEKPKFFFQEIQLTERIADTCWGLNTFIYDANNDNIIGNDGDIFFKLSDINLSGCSGKNTADAMNAYFAKTYGIHINTTPTDCNTKNSRFQAMGS